MKKELKPRKDLKLKLNRETLHNLVQPGELRAVAGGATASACSFCETRVSCTC